MGDSELSASWVKPASANFEMPCVGPSSDEDTSSRSLVTLCDTGRLCGPTTGGPS